MSQQVKGQYNKPKDGNSRLVHVLKPGGYSIEELMQQARSRGWKDNIFPNPDSPNNYPYWDTYRTDRNCPEVLVSKFGEVACCFDRDSAELKYRVLQQQWSYQGKESWSQKYLEVNFNNSPHYTLTHSAHKLHSLVGLVHSPITQEAVYWSQKENKYKLRPKVNLDHLDKEKDNNSVFNLNWITGQQNLVMIDWTLEQKMQFYRDAERLDKNDRDQLLVCC